VFWAAREPWRSLPALATCEARVDGHVVRYQETGAGEPVVLVHGLSGSTFWWGRNVAALAERHRVYLVDLPGFGAMRGLRSQFALARAAHWLRGWMEAVELPRAVLVGHSMGGAICLRLAASYPEAVERLALVAPAGIPWARSLVDEVVPLIAAMRCMTPSFLPILTYDALRAGPVTLLRAARDVLREDVLDAARAVNVPTLLIWGERDTLVPPSGGAILRRELRDARLLLIPGAGHVVMFDRPDAFNEALLAFLDGGTVGE
jgi:pimeloyl-ACP methyl ester carboxylesterase